MKIGNSFANFWQILRLRHLSCQNRLCIAKHAPGVPDEKKLSGETRIFGRQIGSVDESVDFSVESPENSADMEKVFPKNCRISVIQKNR